MPTSGTLQPFIGADQAASNEPMDVGLDDDRIADLVVLNPTLDLDSIASSYSGIALVYRLFFIAEHCPPLELEALRLAHTAVLKTMNTQLYQRIMLAWNTYVSQHPEFGPAPAADTHWIEATDKQAAVKLEKLDTDLKHFKSNSIKESIRRGYDDLGDHHIDCGDLNNALKCYSRSRDYCTSSKHVIAMCLNVIKASVYLNNWSHVLNYVAKAEAVPELTETRERHSSHSMAVNAKLKAASGLAKLACGQYKQAARCFLQANFDAFDYPQVLSPNNVAVYGGLCALATFERQELQQKVLSCSSFKMFLELEPQLRDVLFKFHESKYASCLKTLAEMKDNLLLDFYLSSHVSKLYALIRNKAMVQYFSPYRSASLAKMAVAFNTTVAALEDELTALILDGFISARIDSNAKILYACDTDERSHTFANAMELGQQYQRSVQGIILRSAALRRNLYVRPPTRDDGSSSGMGPPTSSTTR